MIRRSIGVLVLAVVVALVSVPVTATQASSSAAPTLTVTLTEDPTQPHWVGAHGRLFAATVTVAGGAAEDVVVTFGGAGIDAEELNTHLGSVSGSAIATARVRADGGFHTLEIDVTSSNAGTASTSLALLWAPGGTQLPATGDLKGRNYGWRVDYYEPHVGLKHQDYMLSFLDDRRAFIGAPARGRPKCPSVDELGYAECVAYRYDVSTGLVQIGGFVGRVIGNDLYISGIGRAETVNAVSERVVSEGWRYAHRRMRFDGHWTWDVLTSPGGVRAVVDLTMRRDRTFRLITGTDERPVVTTGRFWIPRRGKLVLRGTHGRELHTLGVVRGPDGRPDPALGLWYTGLLHETMTSFRLAPVT